MAKTNKILLILLILLIVPIVSANLGTFKQNDCVNIKTILNNVSWVNISTISYPNLTTIISNVAMAQSGVTFTYDFCNTSVLGNYIYDYYSSDGNSYVNDFSITASGNALTMQDSIIVMIMLGIIIMAAIFFVTVAWFSNDQFLKTIFICLAGFAITISIFFGMTIMFNLLPQYAGFMTNYSAFFYIFTIVLLVAVFALIIWIMVRTFKRMYKMRGREYDDD